MDNIKIQNSIKYIEFLTKDDIVVFQQNHNRKQTRENNTSTIDKPLNVR